MTACVPGQYAYDTADSGAYAGQYGGQYDAEYGYQSDAYGQYGTQVSKTRYGNAAQASGLRPGCNVQAAPCGFMTVVPVYPIYQVEAPQPPAPVVQTVVEPPVVKYYEPEPTVFLDPEPTVIYEPEPVYTPPPSYWPEPETPVHSWKPIRK